MTIVNDNSWVINKLESLLTGDARVVIYVVNEPKVGCYVVNGLEIS